MKSQALLGTRSRVRGISLVESLVALLVLAVGMLGMAALYVEGLRSGRTALVRTRAVLLATDMSDRIRANRQGRDSYRKLIDDAGVLNDACMTGGAGCTPAAMAQHDIAVWHGALDGRVNPPAPTSLPNGRGTIAVPDPTATPVTYVITVQWEEAGQSTQQYVLRIQA